MTFIVSAAAKLASASGEKLAEEVIKFAANKVIDSMYDASLQLVPLRDGEKPASSVDCFIVLAVPLKGSKRLASVSKKFSHSIVVLVDSRTSTGCMVEYGYDEDSSKSVASVTEGRLVYETGDKAIRRTHVRRSSDSEDARIDTEASSMVSDSFVHLAQPLTMDNLIKFERMFEKAAGYCAGAHDCHSFHRSLVATALTGRFVYNYRRPVPRRKNSDSSNTAPRLEFFDLVLSVVSGSQRWRVLTKDFRVGHSKSTLPGTADPCDGMSLKDLIAKFEAEPRKFSQLREMRDDDGTVTVRNMELFAQDKEKEKEEAERARREEEAAARARQEEAERARREEEAERARREKKGAGCVVM